eukprot:TRINITY_DN47244_c0_g1_i1.p1 TRINITY_DN47244_c0_g1~~TRINITY_DN47244_c0_g1_i1.p1  ORF type:complete len:354 (-),score=96.26 TRINITY_DN47244_c0_g1_i1:167-1228(-)
MKTEQSERVKQLTEVLVAIAETSSTGAGRTVVLAGDLNARDDEVATARKQARAKNPHVDNVVDAFWWCGSPKAHEHTWDTSQNNNLDVTYSARCRFDRCLFSCPGLTSGLGAGGAASLAKAAAKAASADASAATRSGWKAEKFELVGRERVPNLGRFPSDHWGLQVTWTLASGKSAAVPAAAAAVSTAPRAEGASGAVVAATCSDPEEERRRKRELAAQRAEMRQAQVATRGIGDAGNRLSKVAKTAGERPGPSDAPREGGSPATSAAAASREAVSEVPTPRVQASAGLAQDENAASDEEDEDAMVARAIALSLQTAKAEGAGTKFKKLGGGITEAAGAASGTAAAPVTIDLD